LSLSLLLPIVAIYILFVSTIVSLLDWSKEGKLLIGGLGFGDAFYFSFVLYFLRPRKFGKFFENFFEIF